MNLGRSVPGGLSVGRYRGAGCQYDEERYARCAVRTVSSPGHTVWPRTQGRGVRAGPAAWPPADPL